MNSETEMKLSETILRAFQSDVYPSPRLAIPEESEEWEETAEFWEKPWSELSIGVYNRYPFCFAYLGFRDFPYYFGAMMYNSIIEGRYENNALDMFLHTWAGVDLSSILDAEDPALDVPTRIAMQIREVVDSEKIDIIREFFDLRRQKIGDHDDELVVSFLSSIGS